KLSKVPGIKTPKFETKKKISWFVYVVKLSESLAGKKRDKIIKEMTKRGIQCGNYFQAIHLQPFWKKEINNQNLVLPITEDISKRTLALPFYNQITNKEIDFVVKKLKEIIDD
ncbi:DegT/DnrJ/EryC1/StrS family aminotransferase, partial [Patescibacteria group bacterium]|nr:DegT/DnrJ/EryC1/StrS family aminotransferase [Patescibacteria group bacterium]MCG2695102.1 DegT/DnrJ/EryC1/StrS family aminotransferase [Candidatus Parcubacteria bacterium]